MADTEAAENYTFILAGKFGVGKSAIFSRISTGEFPSEQLTNGSGPASTASNNPDSSDNGLEQCIYQVNLNGVNYRITIYDTGGLEKYRSMTSNYYRNSAAMILVYDSRPDELNTLFELAEWIREAKERSIRRDRIVLSLWANKCDGVDSSSSAIEPVIAFKNEHGIPDCLHFKVSAKTSANIISSLHSMIEYVHRGDSNNSTAAVGSGTVSRSTGLSTDETTDHDNPTENNSRSRCSC